MIDIVLGTAWVVPFCGPLTYDVKLYFLKKYFGRTQHPLACALYWLQQGTCLNWSSYIGITCSSPVGMFI